jgi:hypothetical protein
MPTALHEHCKRHDFQDDKIPQQSSPILLNMAIFQHWTMQSVRPHEVSMSRTSSFSCCNLVRSVLSERCAEDAVRTAQHAARCVHSSTTRERTGRNLDTSSLSCFGADHKELFNLQEGIVVRLQNQETLGFPRCYRIRGSSVVNSAARTVKRSVLCEIFSINLPGYVA